MPNLEGRTAIVTGAADGLGKAEALALAEAGANLVLGDVSSAVADVAGAAQDRGVRAIAVTGDVSERSTADALIEAATEQLGGLHILVNNAGIVRDRMLFNMSDEEFDAVVKVHLRGHFLLSRNASAYWRALSKKDGNPVGASVINTASEAFLVGSEGQPNYAAAKAGIAALTVATARGMSRYGVRANAICPRARTAMTVGVFGEQAPEGVDPLSVDHVTPLVSYLASAESAAISGQVFVVHGGMVALLAAPTVEQRFDTEYGTWDAAELDKKLGSYFAARDPARSFAATEILQLP